MRQWQRVGILMGLGCLALAGCGRESAPPSTPVVAPMVSASSSKAHSASPASARSHPSPTEDGGGSGWAEALRPTSPAEDRTPVPVQFGGLASAEPGSTLTMSWPADSWSLWSITLWNFNYAPSSYPTEYWGTNAQGAYTLAIPMALQGARVRIIVQFFGPHAQIVTETSPVFVIH
ncbi:hypothetical protein [Sulfobacillus thermosulfidooxidans]|uniref:hypothetical protein n=1 Tax=Sulfobacillus thermosulfidooxidans TaxID=28034 RepID=UPI0006B42AFF|nr:hypothetical protein [Sulfobacillus thermosulfidooxidans]